MQSSILAWNRASGLLSELRELGEPDVQAKGWQLYVDPYTGEILGSLDQADHFMRRVHSFHQRLAGGEVSDVIVGWTAVFQLLLSISGVVLWWRSKMFRIRRGSALRFTFQLHNTLGILSSVYFFLFAWTAICIHWERKVSELAQRMLLEAKYLGAVPAAVGRALNADEILNLGQAFSPKRSRQWCRCRAMPKAHPSWY